MGTAHGRGTISIDIRGILSAQQHDRGASPGLRCQPWGIFGLAFLVISAQVGCAASPEASATDAQSATAGSTATAPTAGTAGPIAVAMTGAAGANVQTAGTPAAAPSSLAAGSGAATVAAGSGGTPAPAAAAAGTGGNATSGAAGMGGAAGAPAMPSVDECGADAEEVTGSMPRGGDDGNTNLQLSGDVEYLEAKSTLTVPSKPAPERGTLFLWPGLQPLRSDSEVGYGVLQPVLTWGSSCAPGSLRESDGWWISAQYVGTPAGSFGVSCKGGDVMKVDIGDKLDIVFKKEGTMWKQTVTNQKNGESVDYTIDLKSQKQQWLLHQIEQPTMVKPSDDVIFTNVVAKLSASQPKSCYPNAKGNNDYFAPPRASADGKTCCISKIILRSSGIKASSPDTP